MHFSRVFSGYCKRLMLPAMRCVVAAAMVVLGAGCTPDVIELRLRPEIVRPPVSVIVFFVDGLDRRTLDMLRTFGRTPNIDRIFEDGGVQVKSAIACIPSATYPNTVSLFTGMFPGSHGVVGNGWFDPTELISTNYISAARYKSVNDHFSSKTLYEYLPDHFTFNIQCPTRRGAGQTVGNEVAAGLAYAIKAFVNIDQLVGSNVTLVADAANRRGGWPSVVVHYFPGVDEIGHQFGSDSSAYRHAVENVDRQIGRIANAIIGAQPAEKLYFILVSDHGHIPVKSSKVASINDYLTKVCGLRVYSGLVEQPSPQARRSVLRNYDAVVLTPSSRQMVIHLRGPDGWGSRVGPERVRQIIASPPGHPDAELMNIRGVGMVCTSPEAGRVHVSTGRGGAVIERRVRGPVSDYRMLGPDGGELEDPLRYFASSSLREFVEAGWHTSREWLEATAETRYPDFVPQIVEYFDSPRAGDLLVFPEADFVFPGHGEGEHGACYRRDMQIPLYFAGPGLPEDAEISRARIVDVLPTILQMLGEERRLVNQPPIDGIGLLDELRRAEAD